MTDILAGFSFNNRVLPRPEKISTRRFDPVTRAFFFQFQFQLGRLFSFERCRLRGALSRHACVLLLTNVHLLVVLGDVLVKNKVKAFTDILAGFVFDKRVLPEGRKEIKRGRVGALFQRPWVPHPDQLISLSLIFTAIACVWDSLSLSLSLSLSV